MRCRSRGGWEENEAEEERDWLFPAQTIHRWGYGTGCWLFALESPRRLLCSGSAQKAPGERGEESASGDNSRVGGRTEWKQNKGMEKEPCPIWCQCEYSVCAKKGRQMMQPYNDQVVGWESIPFPNRDIELVKTEQGGERRVREDEGKQEGMRCREPWLHPSCGLVQKPFVPIVLHNLFSQRLQWEGWREKTKIQQPFIFALIT